jgi:hypothetical protein
MLVDIDTSKIKQVARCLIPRESRPESPPRGPAPRKPERNQPRFDVRGHLHRILGVDLTALPGMSALTAHLFFSETGPIWGDSKAPSTFAP